MGVGGGGSSLGCFFSSDEAVLVQTTAHRHEVDVADQFVFFSLSWITDWVICAAFTDCDNEDCMRSEAVFSPDTQSLV